jgi:hypothetical protein
MTKQNTSSGCKKQNAVEGLDEVSVEDSDPKDKGTSDLEKGPDPQPTERPGCDIDDGGPLSI